MSTKENYNEKKENELLDAYISDPCEHNRDELVVFYLRYVRYICSRIAMELPPHISEDDLISSGVLGLLDAIEKYDPDRDNLFKTYAYTRIRGSVIDELRRLDWVPRSLRKRSREIERAEEQLQHKLGRKASPDEVAESMGITEEEVDHVYRDVKSAAFLSLDEVFSAMSAEKNVARKDTIADANAYTPKKILEDKEFIACLADQIEQLPEIEHKVLVLYYYEELNLKEIGAVLGISESRVSQLHTQAIARLAKQLRKDI